MVMTPAPAATSSAEVQTDNNVSVTTLTMSGVPKISTKTHDLKKNLLKSKIFSSLKWRVKFFRAQNTKIKDLWIKNLINAVQMTLPQSIDKIFVTKEFNKRTRTILKATRHWHWSGENLKQVFVGGSLKSFILHASMVCMGWEKDPGETLRRYTN